MPEGGIDLRRPVYLVGMGGAAVGIDWGMRVNLVRVHAPYGNITFHNLYLENLAYGDRESGRIAGGVSLVNSLNFWLLVYNRWVEGGGEGVF